MKSHAQIFAEIRALKKEIQPEFKVGDRVSHGGDPTDLGTVISIDNWPLITVLMDETGVVSPPVYNFMADTLDTSTQLDYHTGSPT